jgi:hypothetical protein
MAKDLRPEAQLLKPENGSDLSYRYSGAKEPVLILIIIQAAACFASTAPVFLLPRWTGQEPPQWRSMSRVAKTSGDPALAFLRCAGAAALRGSSIHTRCCRSAKTVSSSLVRQSSCPRQTAVLAASAKTSPDCPDYCPVLRPTGGYLDKNGQSAGHRSLC